MSQQAQKKRVTKRAIAASLLSLSICGSMLIGTTYAWFTDTVTSSGNIIKSGTLQVGMNWAEGKFAPDAQPDEDPATDDIVWYDVEDANSPKMFGYDLWEPGYTSVRHIKVTNKGSLALKYCLTILPTDTYDAAALDNLAEVIDVYFYTPATQIESRSVLDESKKIGTLKEVIGDTTKISSRTQGHLSAEQSEAVVTLALKMQETAGNIYQDKEIVGGFDVKLFAAQWTEETDSFDKLYDEQAEFEDMQVPTPVPVPQPEGKTVTSDSGLVKVTVPETAATTEDNFEVRVIGNPRPEPDTNGNYELDLDITLYKNGTPVVPDGTTEYFVTIDIGKNLNVSSFTHDGTAVADDKYGYDPSTGILWFYTASFSPFVTTYYQINTVAFDANGGSGTMTTQSIKHGAESVLPANSFTRDGYDFAGWNTKADGTGASYADGAVFNASANTMLYAQWKEPEQVQPENFTVTFVSGLDGVDSTTQNFTADTPAALTANSFIPKVGYVFNGWNTKADGTGTAYDDRANYTATANTTLYAQWKPIDATSIKFIQSSKFTNVVLEQQEKLMPLPRHQIADQWSEWRFKPACVGRVAMTLDIQPPSVPLESITWTSADPEIATVDQNGIVTGHKSGKVNITATTANGKSCSQYVDVYTCLSMKYDRSVYMGLHSYGGDSTWNYLDVLVVEGETWSSFCEGISNRPALSDTLFTDARHVNQIFFDIAYWMDSSAPTGAYRVYDETESRFVNANDTIDLQHSYLLKQPLP